MIYPERFDFEFFNPWWRVPEAINNDQKIKEFEDQNLKYYHPLFYKFPKKTAVITLRGPRRVGKTTLVKLIIRELLLKEKIPTNQVVYYFCDAVADYKELSQILLEYLEFIRPQRQGQIFIFLDEISFVNEWQRSIKRLVDGGLLDKTTLLLTGSSSVDLLFSSERLAGRWGKVTSPTINFYPLSFKEFVRLTNPQEKALSTPALKNLFNKFLLTGGFPVTINEFWKKRRISSTLYEVFARWIEGDLHKLRKSEGLADEIFSQVFRTLTTPVSFYSLAKDAGIGSHATVIEYLEIFEKMFLTFDLECLLLPQKKRDPKKNRKIYFSDPFIFNTLNAKINGFLDDAFTYSKNEIVQASRKPFLVENTLAAFLKRQFDLLHYGRVGEKEVDFVAKKRGRYFLFESKYEERVSPDEFNWLKKYGLKDLTVITKKSSGERQGVKLIPLEEFLFSFDSC